MAQKVLPEWAATQLPLTSLPPLPARNVKSRSISAQSQCSGVSVGELHREDGRQQYEMRHLFVKTGIVHSADGSCYLKLGGTRILCSVFGPKPNRGRGLNIAEEGDIYVEVTFSPFCQLEASRVTKAGGGSGQASRSAESLTGDKTRLASSIVQTFQSVVLTDRFPNSGIEIAILVIEDEGGIIPAGINCVSLALADAKIPMKDICTAATICVFDVDKKKLGSQRPAINDISFDGKSVDDYQRPISTIDSNKSELQENRDPIFLVDPTISEILHGPLRSPFGHDHLEGDCAILHLGLCASDLSVAFLDASGLPLDPPLDNQIIQLAENACCEASRAFKQQLKSVFLKKQIKDKIDSQLASDLLSAMDTPAVLSEV